MSDPLEQEAISFYNSVPKFARTAAFKGFLNRLADRLGWTNLKGVL